MEFDFADPCHYRVITGNQRWWYWSSDYIWFAEFIWEIYAIKRNRRRLSYHGTANAFWYSYSVRNHCWWFEINKGLFSTEKSPKSVFIIFPVRNIKYGGAQLDWENIFITLLVVLFVASVNYFLFKYIFWDLIWIQLIYLVKK